MSNFPPEDISGFLEFNAGEWLALRSLLGPESADLPLDNSPSPAGDIPEATNSWHQSDRGELTIVLLQAEEDNCGGLEVNTPSGEKLRLIFFADGTLHRNTRVGSWQLGNDGILELEVNEEKRMIKERIWFSKPNLRLRCTLEEWSDGRPARASFSSEIRRVSRPPQAATSKQTE